MNNTIKAIRATIKLGDIELEGFLMPDGTQLMSKSQACKAIDLEQKRLSQLMELKEVQTLVPQGLKVIRISSDNARIDGLTLGQRHLP